jgi:hypothetical protein
LDDRNGSFGVGNNVPKLPPEFHRRHFALTSKMAERAAKSAVHCMKIMPVRKTAQSRGTIGSAFFSAAPKVKGDFGKIHHALIERPDFGHL